MSRKTHTECNKWRNKQTPHSSEYSDAWTQVHGGDDSQHTGMKQALGQGEGSLEDIDKQHLLGQQNTSIKQLLGQRGRKQQHIVIWNANGQDKENQQHTGITNSLKEGRGNLPKTSVQQSPCNEKVGPPDLMTLQPLPLIAFPGLHQVGQQGTVADDDLWDRD